MKRKLTPPQVAYIRSSHETQTVLAEQFNVTPAAIGHIRTGRSYPELPGAKTRDRGRPRTRFARPCRCGCGEMTNLGATWRIGHNLRAGSGARPQEVS